MSWKISYSYATCAIPWAWLRCRWEHKPALAAEESRLRQVMGCSSEGLRENNWDWKRKWCKSSGEKRLGRMPVGCWGTEWGRTQLAPRKVWEVVAGGGGGCSWAERGYPAGLWLWHVVSGCEDWNTDWLWQLLGDEVDCYYSINVAVLRKYRIKVLAVCLHKKDVCNQ